VALHLQGIHREDRPGGSLALGELLDLYGEEIFLDLKEFWDFDLVSFFAGEVFSSITLIFSMIHNLPEGSRYVAARQTDADDEEKADIEVDPRAEALMDNRVWTIDRRLMAMAINAIYSQVTVSGHWGDSGPPEFPVIGPSEWRVEESKPEELKDNFDVLRKMGWPGG